MSSLEIQTTDQCSKFDNRTPNQSIDDSQGFLNMTKQQNNLSNAKNQVMVNQKDNKYSVIVLLILSIIFIFYALFQWYQISEPVVNNQIQQANSSKFASQIQQKQMISQNQINETLTINISLNIFQNKKLILPFRMGKVHTLYKVQQVSLQPLDWSLSTQAQSLLASNMPAEYLAYTFYQNWLGDNKTIDLAEFLQIDHKYQISKYIPEKSICVISPFKNLITNPSSNSLNSYLKSLNFQNYSNFHVYMIDDASTDGSTPFVLKTVRQKYARLHNRLTIIRNVKSIGALGNRDIISRNYCNEDDIIIQVDADDCLIGKQTFKLYNKLYSDNSQIWFLYSNYIMKMVTAKSKPPKIGRNQQIKYQIHAANTYRTALKYWVTVHLRSYLRKLYVKIPIEYFFQQGTKIYYPWASDRFNMYPLVQLAGPKHTLFVPQLLYYYNLPDDTRRLRRNCDVPMIRYQSTISKTQIPLMPLENLDQVAEITKKYQVPSILQEMVKDKKNEYEKCLQAHKQDRQ